MPLSLYDAMIPSQLQILESVQRLVEKADLFCKERDWDERTVLEAQLAPDMMPFAYQVKSVAVHSLGALEGLRQGRFSPDRRDPPSSFMGLSARVTETIALLEQVEPRELDDFLGQTVQFVADETTITFTAENFLLSFSQPNFYFHATTAYNILRSKGVALGKRDFNGRVRRIR